MEKSNLTILLIHPEISRTKYNFVGIIENECLELEYISTILKEKGHTVYLYDGQVEALEFRVTKNAKVIEKSLFELNLKNNLLVCCISRKGKIITPSGQDMLMPGDGVIVVTTNTGLRDIDDILAVNKA